MRSLEDIKNTFLMQARKDNRIRAVLLQGSRANKNVQPDPFQDFDIFLLVREMESFLSDFSWTSIYGKKIAWQLPDEMELRNPVKNENPTFHYLMLFEDGTRIDLSLFPVEKINTHFKKDSLTEVWVDKDSLFSNLEPPSDKDYRIRKPAENEFAACCNEFWWVSTYISKGLLRNEITLAKAMMEGPVREMFMRMIEWRIGTETDFTVSFGKEGKFMTSYLSESDYHEILLTYPDHQTENIWNSLFKMTELFSRFARIVSENLHYPYNLDEQNNIQKFLFQEYEKRK